MYVSIKKIFENAQYFGFTCTPRFEQNKSEDGRTTADIFHKCIHKYLLNNAIADGNFLGFNVVTIWNQLEIKKTLMMNLLIVDSRINSISKDIIKKFSKKYGKKYKMLYLLLIEANEDLNNKDFYFKIELEKIIKDYNINFDTNFNITDLMNILLIYKSKLKTKKLIY